jgi:hypothetical protein
VIDPSNVQTVYAGTGEENFSGNSLLVASDFGVLSLDQRRRGLHADWPALRPTWCLIRSLQARSMPRSAVAGNAANGVTSRPMAEPAGSSSAAGCRASQRTNLADFGLFILPLV